ncbi:MAG TPA: Hsp70 family protein [Bryobacteraceae bacterium]|nr:Hsp70 family protein [Bryobacteraceae bacterium]
MHIGLDFGTTNSSIARVTGPGAVELTRFRLGDAFTESFRSLLYLERLKEAGRTTIKSWAGPEGIERYLEADDKGRLIQSLKSFLSSRSLQTTEIFGRRFQLEELIAKVLRDIRSHAEKQFGSAVRGAVVGKPVRFVGAASNEEDEYATGRLTVALHKAGFEQVAFEYEPVAAAYYYESNLDHDELIVIGDFGGGTSDFSLLRVGPSQRKLGDGPRAVLGNEGLPLAGDAFDAKIIRHLVSPALGAGSELDSNGKLLPVPNWVYFKLERWHHLSFLKSRETMNMLKSVVTQALEGDKLAALVYLIEHDLGYHLHRAVQKVKIGLSRNESEVFRFVDGDVELEAQVTRAEFELWIAEELADVEEKVNSLLAKTGVDAKDVDMVFLTGGSSFVPAVRRIFETRFGGRKIRTGDEFTSVARGLALRAAE